MSDSLPILEHIERSIQSEGDRRKEAGIAAVQLNDMLWHDNWSGKAKHYAIEFAKTHGYVTPDDIHTICPMPPGLNRNAMGGLFATAKELEFVRYDKSKRPERHGARNGVYRYVGGMA